MKHLTYCGGYCSKSKILFFLALGRLWDCYKIYYIFIACAKLPFSKKKKKSINNANALLKNKLYLTVTARISLTVSLKFVNNYTSLVVPEILEVLQ